MAYILFFGATPTGWTAASCRERLNYLPAFHPLKHRLTSGEAWHLLACVWLDLRRPGSCIANVLVCIKTWLWWCYKVWSPFCSLLLYVTAVLMHSALSTLVLRFLDILFVKVWLSCTHLWICIIGTLHIVFPVDIYDHCASLKILCRPRYVHQGSLL